MIKQSEGNSSLCCCILGGECSLEGFLDLGPVLVSVCDVFIFKLGEPSLGKGFSSFLGYSIEENYGSCFIGKFVHMKGKIGLHGYEPSVGISSFFTELFRKRGFNVHHVVVASLSERGSMWMGKGKSESEGSGKLGGKEAAGGTGRSKYYIWVRFPNRIVDHKWCPLEKIVGG